MGHRLSQIVTRTGDDGTTGLGDGSRVSKDAQRIEAMGSVDELNCALGVLLATSLPDERAHATVSAVSYTHLDVYKRQRVQRGVSGQHRGRVQPDIATGEVGEAATGLAHDDREGGDVEDVDIGLDHRIERATRCLLYTSRCV